MVDVQRPLLLLFWWLKGARGTSTTWIPYSTSIKNRGFKVSTCKTPLGWTLEAFWSPWQGSPSLSRSAFGGPLANLTGVHRGQIQFFRDSGGVEACCCVRMASGKAFGWCLEAVLVGQSCFLAVLFVVRTWIFRPLPEGLRGRCALHLSHALEASCCSAKRSDDVIS